MGNREWGTRNDVRRNAECCTHVVSYHSILSTRQERSAELRNCAIPCMWLWRTQICQQPTRRYETDESYDVEVLIKYFNGSTVSLSCLFDSSMTLKGNAVH